MTRWSGIDFGLAPRRPWRGIVLLLAALALLAWQVPPWLAARQLLEERQQALIDLQPSQRPAAKPSAAEQRRRAQIDAVAAHLAAPWEALLAVFESHSKRGVTLRRLEPDAASGQVRLIGEARTLTQMMDYVQALESDARLQQVLLQSHEQSHESAGAPIEFALTAAWRARAADSAAPAQRSTERGGR